MALLLRDGKTKQWEGTADATRPSDAGLRKCLYALCPGPASGIGVASPVLEADGIRARLLKRTVDYEALGFRAGSESFADYRDLVRYGNPPHLAQVGAGIDCRASANAPECVAFATQGIRDEDRYLSVAAR